MFGFGDLDFRLLFISIIGGGGGLLFGLNTTIIGGAILFITNDFTLSVFETSLIIAFVPLGSLFGTIFSGFLSDKMGRLRTIHAQNFFYFIGALICSSANNVAMLYVGRFFVGIGSALAAVGDIPYLNEISPTSHRGLLSSSFEIQIVFGTVIGSLLCLLIQSFPSASAWRVLLAIPTIPAFINSLLSLTIPESPKWLVQRGFEKEARSSLASLRRLEGPSESQQLDSEFSAFLSEFRTLQEDIDASPHHSLFEAFRLPLLLVVCLLFFAQFSGPVVIRSYAPTIFREAGFSTNLSLALNLIISTVNLLFVSFSSFRTDLTGRKTLLLLGTAIAALGALLLSLAFISSSNGNIPLFLFSCLLTSIGFNIGFGPVGWLLASEMFPPKIRGRALAVSTGFRNVFEFVSQFLFLAAVAGIGPGATFGLFFVVALLALLFIARFIVETKHREPHDILLSLSRQAKQPAQLWPFHRFSSSSSSSQSLQSWLWDLWNGEEERGEGDESDRVGTRGGGGGGGVSQGRPLSRSSEEEEGEGSAGNHELSVPTHNPLNPQTTK